MTHKVEVKGDIITPSIDKVTGAFNTVDYAHHEIHGGSAYEVEQSSALNGLDIATPMTFHIVTPDTAKWAHMLFLASVADNAILEVFEDDGNASHFDISGGTTVIAINQNRNSDNISGLRIKKGVTVTQATDDCLIREERIGGRRQAGSAMQRPEMILKQNAAYLVRITSDVDNNEGVMSLNWYEHTSKF